jgi:hypothetical protein
VMWEKVMEIARVLLGWVIWCCPRIGDYWFIEGKIYTRVRYSWVNSMVYVTRSILHGYFNPLVFWY